MSTLVVRWVFAALCGVFFFAIGGVAAWESIRFQRRESALSARHFRWRLLSAATWLLVLGALFVATVFLWPRSHADTILAKRFLLVSSSALVLMIFAFVLMSVDVFWTIQVGRKSALLRTRKSQEELQRQLGRVAKSDGGPDATP